MNVFNSHIKAPCAEESRRANPAGASCARSVPAHETPLLKELRQNHQSLAEEARTHGTPKAFEGCPVFEELVARKEQDASGN